MVERRNLMKHMQMDQTNSSDDIPLRQRTRMANIRGGPPPKTTAAAIILLLGGIIFLTLGITMYIKTHGTREKDRGLAMIILGGIMFIPGSYASTVLFGAWRGWNGYDYTMVPSYDD